MTCATAGDVLLSAAPAYEFLDWGGQAHVGGGSHGSLHRSDSLGPLLMCGTPVRSRDEREQWSISDVKGLVARHFGVAGRYPEPMRMAAVLALATIGLGASRLRQRWPPPSSGRPPSLLRQRWLPPRAPSPLRRR